MENVPPSTSNSIWSILPFYDTYQNIKRSAAIANQTTQMVEPLLPLIKSHLPSPPPAPLAPPSAPSSSSSSSSSAPALAVPPPLPTWNFRDMGKNFAKGVYDGVSDLLTPSSSDARTPTATFDGLIASYSQRLQNLMQDHPEMNQPYRTRLDVETQVEKLCETSAFMGTYNAIYYFLGAPPQENPAQGLSFQDIMARINATTLDPAQRRALFQAKLDEEIGKRTDVFFLKRWCLYPLSWFVLWISEVITNRFSEGAKKGLREITTTPRSRNMNAPIEILTNVANGLTEGYRLAANGDNAISESLQTCIESVFGNSVFLHGHQNLHALCAQFEQVAIDELMLEFHAMTSACDEAMAWLSSDNIILEIVLTVPRTIIWTLKTFVCAPLEWIGNKCVKWVTKYFIPGTAENVTRMAHAALFPNNQNEFSEIIDKVIIDLLDKLQTILRAPANPHFADLHVHESTNVALERCLNAMVESLRVSRLNNNEQERLNWYQQIEQSLRSFATPQVIKGIIEVLNRSYQILTEEQMLYQMFYHTLNVCTESMLKRETAPLTLQERQQQAEARKNTIRYQINLLLAESIKIATSSAPSDNPMQNHVRELHGAIPQLESQLTSITNPSTPAEQTFAHLHSIHRNLNTIQTHMRDGLVRMVNEQVTRQQPLPRNAELLDAIQASLQQFQNAFLEIYYQRFRSALPEDVTSKFSQVALHVSNLRNGLASSPNIRQLEASIQGMERLSLDLCNQLRGNTYPADFCQLPEALLQEAATCRTLVNCLKQGRANIETATIQNRLSELENWSHLQIQGILQAKSGIDTEATRVRVQQALNTLKACINIPIEPLSAQGPVSGQMKIMEKLKLHEHLSNDVYELVNLYTRQGAVFEAILSRAYVYFLESYNQSPSA